MRMLRERPDDARGYLWFAMFPFAAAGIVTGTYPLIALSGAVIVFVAVLLVTDYNDVLERLSARYRDSWSWRLQGKHRFTRFEGVICLLVGLGWLVGGVVGS